MPAPDQLALLRLCCEEDAACQFVRLPGGRTRHIKVRYPWLEMEDAAELDRLIEERTLPSRCQYGNYRECLDLALIITHGDEDRTYHVDRVIAGCLMLHFLSLGERDFFANHDRLGRMIESVLELGGQHVEACEKFLSWLVERSGSLIPSYLALGIVLLQAHRRAPIDFDAQLAALDAQWKEDLLRFAAEVDYETFKLDTPGEQAEWIQLRVDEGDLIWILCLDVEAEFHSWRRMANALAQRDGAPSAIVEVQRRLNPPKWAPARPVRRLS
jgi:hypothetical protein